MPSATRVNYWLVVSMAISYVLGGLIYLMDFIFGSADIVLFGMNLDLVVAVLWIGLGLYWTYVACRSGGSVSMKR